MFGLIDAKEFNVLILIPVFSDQQSEFYDPNSRKRWTITRPNALDKYVNYNNTTIPYHIT